VEKYLLSIQGMRKPVSFNDITFFESDNVAAAQDGLEYH